MASDQVYIFSSGSLYQAELIRQMLHDHDIPAFTLNKQDSFYKFGEIEIYVHRDHVIRAKLLIKEFESK